MGGALILCSALIVGLLSLIVVRGLSTFWPRPIDRVVLRSGETFLGVPIREEAFDPSPALREELDRLCDAGQIPQGATDADGRPIRVQYRIGNREINQQPFRWVSRHEIASTDRPPHAVMLERQDWGVWIGLPSAIVEQHVVEIPQGQAIEPESIDAGRRVTRSVLGSSPTGGQRVLVRTHLAEGEAQTLAAFPELHARAVDRADEINRLRKADIGRLNAQIERWRKAVQHAELRLRDAQAGLDDRIGFWPWLGVLTLTAAAGALATILTRRQTTTLRAGSRRVGLKLGLSAAWCLTGLGALAVVLERPIEPFDESRAAAIRQQADEATAQLSAQTQALLQEIAQKAEADARTRAIFTDLTTGRFAPMRQTLPDEPLVLSQIVRLVQPNELSLLGKLGVYADRWIEYLTAEPRNVNTEGGVLPVIFGTVLLTILLSITVVPLGVVAALYLREYARQGIVTSLVRIAVNNLAGVPSIVYGVFGLGFFCYTLGQYIDGGPDAHAALPRFGWWFLAGGSAVVVFGALALAIAARPRPGQLPSALQRGMKRLCAVLWLAAVVLVAALFATTPYFQGFFRAGLPASTTFGSRGLLWGALTLALLTLPVVIVSTEEAIAAVPRSMREGSYGCGASRWQTVKRIVLPGAMPGIMTGMILAMARGTGEVAPLMIVGAVKNADQLPISANWPFLHLERTFMHLGFHIYDLGFQSPDAEAARPLVWTTTLLLITIVVLLNLVAITVRGRLRSRLSSGHF